MWIWLGLSGIGAYLVARSTARRWKFTGEPRIGAVHGKQFAYELETRTQKRTRVDRIAVPMADGVEFRIAREGSFARFLHRIGVGREIETGLASFDDDYEIQSADPQLGAWLRDSMHARTFIGRLFTSLGVAEIVAHRGRLMTGLTATDEGVASDAKARRIAQALTELAACDPPQRPTYETHALKLWGRAMPVMLWTYGWALAAAMLWLANAFEVYPSTVNANEFALRLGTITALATPLVLYAAARWMRDSTVARLVLFELLLIGTPAFVIGGTLAGIRANTDWASGPTHQQQTSISYVDRTRHRRSSTYYLVVKPWSDLGPEARFQVQQATYQNAKGGDRVEIVWREGALGQPIVVQAPTILKAQ